MYLWPLVFKNQNHLLGQQKHISVKVRDQTFIFRLITFSTKRVSRTIFTIISQTLRDKKVLNFTDPFPRWIICLCPSQIKLTSSLYTEWRSFFHSGKRKEIVRILLCSKRPVQSHADSHRCEIFGGGVLYGMTKIIHILSIVLCTSRLRFESASKSSTSL